MEDFGTLKGLAEKHAPEVGVFLSAMEEEGATTGPITEITSLLQMISSHSPVCGYIHLSAVPILDELLSDSLQLSSVTFQRSLQDEIPALIHLISKQPLPIYLVGILRRLRELAVKPFVDVETPMEEEKQFDPSEDTYSLFPAWPKVRDQYQYITGK